MKRKIFFIIGIIILCIIILIGSFYLFILSGAIFLFGSDPPKPEITYGEFPFSITYELNGEVRVIEYTVVCEFDGIESRGSAGKYRKWKKYIKSGDSSIGFFPTGKDDATLEVGISSGVPNYYMGDFEQSREEYERMMNDDSDRKYVEWKNGAKTGNSFTEEEAWEKYKLRIIDIEYSQPIKNSFK